VRSPGAPGGAEETVRSMLVAAEAWLGGQPSTVRTLGGGNVLESVVHASWPDGAAAILTAADGPGEAANDLILLGSRGAIYFGRTPEAAGG
jgi:hypothetical protein